MPKYCDPELVEAVIDAWVDAHEAADALWEARGPKLSPRQTDQVRETLTAVELRYGVPAYAEALGAGRDECLAAYPVVTTQVLSAREQGRPPRRRAS
jgi:hypothetical protein